jgi:3-phenylpropionate/trans-cinnamate dioxygenase ferredoxin reductase component
MVSDGLIIIGASLAGAKAAEGARAHGWDGPIRLVGEEPLLPYERPPLSKKVLIGADEPSAALVHDPSFYVTNEIDLLLGARANAIDLAARRVDLDGGRQLRFDKLVLATGSSVRRLPIKGAELPEVRYLRTMADMLALRDELLPGRRVGVIGASWIGTEVAACARQRRCEVAMIDPTETPLERVLGTEVGAYFARLHAAHGVELYMGMGVDGIEGAEHVKGVVLSDGRTVDADLVVVGVGVTPNIDLARDAGLAVGRGVLVDQTLTTSHDDVLAAGDIAEAEHPRSSERVRVEHWANALNQGLTAGANAAGGREIYDRIPYFYSDQYDDMSMEHSGWPTAFDRVEFRGDPNEGAFVAFYLSGDRVIAGANVNVWDVNEHVQDLIRANEPVNVKVLTDPDVDPADWTASAHQ